MAPANWPLNWTMSAPLLVADSGPLIALAQTDLLSIPARIVMATGPRPGGQAADRAPLLMRWRILWARPWPIRRRPMDWRDHIASNPDILVGKPSVKGTWISVELMRDEAFIALDKATA